MENIILKDINKSFGDLKVLKNINGEFEKGKISYFTGDSGSGKTTLLRIIAGLEKQDSGEIKGTENKHISYLFQDIRLLEWKTLYENIEFVLKDIFIKKKYNQIIEEVLQIVELENFKNYYPKELSGGMQQRLALARSLAFPHDILILDEPFKQIDQNLKQRIIKKIIQKQKQDKQTIIIATHEKKECEEMGKNVEILVT